MQRGLFILAFLCTVHGFAQVPKVFINELVAHNTNVQDRFREYDDWVELYNDEDTAVNVGGMYFTDNLSEPKKVQILSKYPSLTTIPAKGHKVFWFDKGSRQYASEHINLKLSVGGEQVGLYTTEGVVIDSVTFGVQRKNISYGRAIDGGSKWVYFTTPSYNQPNTRNGKEGFSAAPTFTKEGGFYPNKVQVKINAPKGATIYYTLDGSHPTTTGNVYNTPLSIDTTTIVRAMVIEEGKLPGTITSNSYFIGVTHQLPVVSIAIDNYKIFVNTDPKLNIYNESPAYVSLFEKDHQQAFELNAGLRLVGKAIRNYPQKSISMHARSMFGHSDINYPLFPGKPAQSYQAFLLRNSGNDWPNTLLKDALMHTLVTQTNIDYQAYRPVVVYINGIYWGIHNLREKICQHYIKNNHPNAGSIDMFEYGSMPIQGDDTHLQQLKTFVQHHDLSNASNYDSVLQMIDVNNFIDYQIAEIFYANTDWPMANMKFWRPKHEDGKWRWILFDTDLAFESDKARCPGHLNSIDYALGINNCHLPHLTKSLQASTYLLQALIKNPTFKAQFINRFADMLNTTFKEEKVVSTIRAMEAALTPEMPQHIGRWGKNKGIRSMKEWQKNINKLVQFAEERPDTMRYFLAQNFQLKGTTTLTVVPGEGGTVQLNSLTLNTPFEGTYFKHIPVTMMAVPNNGYVFDRWEGVEGKESELTYTPNKDARIRAIFKKR